MDLGLDPLEVETAVVRGPRSRRTAVTGMDVLVPVMDGTTRRAVVDCWCNGVSKTDTAPASSEGL
jgi:hypothetical protein